MAIQASRPSPSGLHRGAPYTRVSGVGPILELVSREMVEAESLLHEMLRETTPAVSEISSYLAQAGGKRLRPLLTALGARAAGHTGSIARLMCVGELIHLGSLLHDDVVDDGHERRGMPTAWRVYGNPGVILAGDFCVSLGIRVAAEEAGIEAVTALARTVQAMSEGEVTQLLHAGDVSIPRETYFEVIHKKTARLIAWCAAAGAWSLGRPETAQALSTFGQNVGEAFQITDDVLDYVGEERLTGKRRGQDLLEGKLTLPLLLAVERSPGLAERVRELTPEQVPGVLRAVRACGAADDALAVARERVRTGLDALETLPDSSARRALSALGHHIVERSS